MSRKSSATALNNLCDRLNSGLLDNKIEKSVTFVAATTGAVGVFDIATVTGTVAMSVFAVCSADVTSGGAAKIEVGTALSTAGMIAQTTATDIDEGDIWHDATPDSSIELTSVITQKIVTQKVSYKISATTITGGTLKFLILWAPISVDGNVVIA